jgi:hypothetical protein
MFAQICPDLLYVAPRLAASSIQSQNKKIRIGFISTNFFDHSIGKIMIELFYYLQLRGDSSSVIFEFFIFQIDKSLNRPYLNSNGNRIVPLNTFEEINNYNQFYYEKEVKEDYITTKLKDIFRDNFIKLPQDIFVLRNVVGSNYYNLDILVYSDIGMDFITYISAISRLARYQVLMI